MKRKYNTPVSELVQELLTACIRDGSIDAELPSYGEGEELVW